MTFKYFRFKLIIRVIITAIFMFIFIYSINQEKWYVTSSVALLICILLIGELIYFVETTNRELGKFLLSIKYKDFTNIYTVKGKNKGSFPELKQAFNEIVHEFQNVRIEKELHYQYLQTIFSHTKTAMVCYENNGNIQLINEAAKKLLNVKQIEKIEQLERLVPPIYAAIKNITPDSENIIKTNIQNNIAHLSLQCTIFKLMDKTYKMVSIHDIKNALEEQELDSWKKLIRVLNHEIMNSVTPISSLSSALNKMLTDENGNKKDLSAIPTDDASDLLNSLETIENRSKGLLNFVTTYKKITKLPKPKLSTVNIAGLIKHVTTLLKPELEKRNIELKIRINESQEINADHEMIEQVIINLLLNSIDVL